MEDVMLEQEELLCEQRTAAEEEAVLPEQDEERPPERNMGARSSQIAANALTLIRQHVGERKLGKVFATDCGYQIQGDTKKVRFPDGSFVAHGRLPDERTPEGNLQLAPDLALEVVSPNDSAYEVEEKRVAYLKGGVRLLWFVYPPTKVIFVYRPGRKVTEFGEADMLTGEDVLPDFSCPVARFFEDL